MVGHLPQRRRSRSGVRAVRGPDHGRLAERLHVRALDQAAHDRGQRDGPPHWRPPPALRPCGIRRSAAAVTVHPAKRAWAMTRMATRLSPPKAKKSSATPMPGTSRTSANTPSSACSAAPAGGRLSDGVSSGAGSAARSSLPFGQDRQAVQRRRMRWAPCSRAAPGRQLPQALRGVDDVGDQPAVAHLHGHLGGPAAQHRLDLARFHPVAAHLDLVVGAALVVEPAVGRSSGPGRRYGTCAPRPRRGRPRIVRRSGRAGSGSRAPGPRPDRYSSPVTPGATGRRPASRTYARVLATGRPTSGRRRCRRCGRPGRRPWPRSGRRG